MARRHFFGYSNIAVYQYSLAWEIVGYFGFGLSLVISPRMQSGGWDVNSAWKSRTFVVASGGAEESKVGQLDWGKR